MTPNRVKRAHWPTKENLAKSLQFLDSSGPRKKMPGRAPNGAGRFFFRLIQTLPTFWATRISILRIFMFGIFLDPKKESQKYRFSKSKSVSPNMSARCGLAGKRTSRPHLGPSQAFFCVGRGNKKMSKFCIFSLVGQ